MRRTRAAARPGDGAVLTAALALGLLGARTAAAQVIEIAAGGAVTTYDGPAVFDARGSTPIRTPAVLRRPAQASRPLIESAAASAELSPALIEAVARQESGLRPGVVSRAGAVGEMQLMPATARELGVDPRDPAANLRGGAAYLRSLMRRYDGDLQRVLAAYNAGPAAVDRHGGAAPYAETRSYVAAVLERLSRRSEEEADAK